MPTIPERLETATAQIEADAVKQHAITHGADDAADVVTEGGPVKPFAKVAKEGEDGFDAAIASKSAAADSMIATKGAAADSMISTKAGLADTQRTTDAAASATATAQISFQAVNYQGDISSLSQALVAPASNVGKWYSSLVAGVLSGTNSGGITVAVGDLVFSDGTSTWKKRGTLPVIITRAQLSATLQTEIPADSAGEVGSTYGEIYWAVVGSDKAIGLAVGKDGKVYGKFILQNAAVVAAMLAAASVTTSALQDGAVTQTKIAPSVIDLTRLDATMQQRVGEDRTALGQATEMAYALIDSNNRIGFGIRYDGKLCGRFFDVGGGLTLTYDAQGHPTLTRPDDPTSGVQSFGDVVMDASNTGDWGDYVYVVIDSQKRIGFGIKKDGSITAKLDAVNQEQIDESIDEALTAAFADGSKIVLPGDTYRDGWGRPAKAVAAKNVVCVGDSLTAGGYPNYLALTGRTITDLGVGGENSLSIKRRWTGGLQFAYPIAGVDTITNGTIVPIRADLIAGQVTAKIDPVERVDFFNNGLYIGSSTAANGSDQWIFNWHFTGTTGNNTYNITMRVKTQHDSQVAVLWLGRNDVHNTGYNGTLGIYPWQSVVETIRDAVDHVKTFTKRFIVMSVLNMREVPINDGSSYGAETSNVASPYYTSLGHAAYTQVKAINAWLAAAYPDNYLDIHQVLMDNATLPGDQDDVDWDIHPTSLRSDSIHLNTTGQQVVALAVRTFILNKGW
jgi:lysophospholipase L1-like esterase